MQINVLNAEGLKQDSKLDAGIVDEINSLAVGNILLNLST
jgi:hypothetical protein